MRDTPGENPVPPFVDDNHKDNFTDVSGAGEKNLQPVELIENVDTPGLYSDNNGAQWITVELAPSQFDIGVVRLLQILRIDEVRRIKAPGSYPGRIPYLYNVQDVQEVLAAEYEHLSRKVDEKTNIYIDDTGQEWTTLAFLSNGTHRTAPLLLELINKTNVRQMTGSLRGRKVALYNLQEFQKVYGEQHIVNPETGVYEDSEHKRWSNVTWFHTQYNISDGVLDRLIEVNNVSFIDGISAGGDTTKLYNAETLEDLIKEWEESHTELPQVDKETGIYIDDKGKRWSSRKITARKLGKDPEFVDQIAKNNNVATIQGISYGQPSSLYDLDFVEAIFENNYKGKPTVDKKTGIYTDEKGEQWCTPYLASQKLGLGRRMADKIYEESKLPFLDGIDNLNRLSKLVNLTLLTSFFNENYRAKPWVDKDTGIYTDPEGTRWTYAKKAAKILERTNLL